MRMTLTQFNGFSKAVAREARRRFADRAAAVRIAQAENKDYRDIMQKLDNLDG